MPPLVVIIGPSGSGKSTVVRELHRRGVVCAVPTWTTRPKRGDEHAGSVEHRFVSDATFDALDASGFFVETAKMPGLAHRYGLPQLSTQPGPAKALVSRAAHVPAIAGCVYQVTVPREVARTRLIARGCPPAELDARLGDHEREDGAGRVVADRVFVNDGALDDILNALAEEIRTGGAA